MTIFAAWLNWNANTPCNGNGRIAAAKLKGQNLKATGSETQRMEQGNKVMAAGEITAARSHEKIATEKATFIEW